jgi:hypothetical protein
MKSTLWIFLFSFMMTGPALATTFTHKLELENKIAEKVRSILSQVDLQSQVIVEVRLKKISTKLPGTGSEVVDMFSEGQSQTIDLDDIERIDVKVLSRLPELPKTIQKQIQDSFFGQKRVAIKYEKMTDNVSKILNQREEYETQQKEIVQSISSNLSEISGVTKSLKNTLIWLMVGLFWVGIIVYWLSGRRAISHYKMMAEVFAEKIGAKLNRPEDDRNVIDLNQRMQLNQPHESESQAQLSHESQRLEMMSSVSLAALISDCYWCEEDGYAVWLWNHMSPQKRREILGVWPKADSYVRSLARVPAHMLQHHNHLHYLKPLPVLDVSQADLKFWVGRYPGAWNMISPLRQSHMDYSLKEKIEFSRQAPAGDILSKLPKPSSASRDLEMPLEIGLLTEEDEMAILAMPESVPDHLRPDIPSLVWVALLPPQEREILLSGVSAHFLAEVWVGPHEVLSKLQEVMPEKKWTLLSDYLQRVSPRRDSAHLMSLSREAVRLLQRLPKQVTGGTHEERKIS